MKLAAKDLTSLSFFTNRGTTNADDNLFWLTPDLEAVVTLNAGDLDDRELTLSTVMLDSGKVILDGKEENDGDYWSETYTLDGDDEIEITIDRVTRETVLA